MRYPYKRIIAVLAVLSITASVYWSLERHLAGAFLRLRTPGDPLLHSRRAEIKGAFKHAWTGYAAHCMGHDSLHPVTNTCDNEMGGWGATALEALPLAILLDEAKTVHDILNFVQTLNFTVAAAEGSYVPLLQLTGRHLGSLLSAHDLLSGPYANLASDQRGALEMLHANAVGLGGSLSCAFLTPSGIPRDQFDPMRCTTDSAYANSLAGAGSLILEFARLSDLSGHKFYAELAGKAEKYLLDPKPADTMAFPGLLGAKVRVWDGTFHDKSGTLGNSGGSFYEYLLKANVYNPDNFGTYLERWKLAADSTISYITSEPFGHSEWVMVPRWRNRTIIETMDASTWSAGANFILGSLVTDNTTLVDYGLSVADTVGGVYQSTPAGLGGEAYEWTSDCNQRFLEKYDLELCNANTTVKVTDPRYLLRGEAFESWYYAYTVTKDSKYRDWAWSVFQAINRTCRTESGFSAISDVMAVDGGEKLNFMDSSIFAKVLKYLWLMHLGDHEDLFAAGSMQSDKGSGWVFNTSGHPISIANSRHTH